MHTALLLIAHGSREAEANADLHHVVATLRSRGEYPIIEACFLELAQPDIDAGAAGCVAQGANRVLLVPYFLAAGVHVRRDLEQARARLSERYPQIEVRLAEPLGRHPMLVEVLAERAREADRM
jgi:sirohydrochlorin ferrochelatase